ncbi:MAG TPA: enolase C-terminal domain-like protein [Microbacterium sp.]|uniref:enolase C-terminal domain-like protein n=1 Tax=Microbacterium sp. TaxID=51671 RepID=UPI002F95B602
MKITDVTIERGPEGRTEVRNWRHGLPRREQVSRPGQLVLTSESGHTGRCDVRDAVMAGAFVERHLRSELVGQDLFAREHLWKRVWEVHRLEYLPTHLLGVVDVALWDLAGQVLDLPVHRIAGFARESIRAYASTATFGSESEYLDVVDQCIELGFSVIKLHAWGDARRDAALAGRVREHVGSGVQLLFDGSGGYDLADAVYLGHALSDTQFEWFEEPLSEYSITAHRMLADRVAVPLILAEITQGAHQSAGDYIASGAAVGVRVSGELKGGITGALKVAAVADAYRMRAEVHGPGVVSTALCMMISNNSFYESLVLTNPVRPDAALTDGLLTASELPGIGWPR